MVSAVCYLYASSTGLALALVVFAMMALGALPFAFPRGDAPPVTTGGFFGHLDELRWRLQRVLCWVLAAFILLPMMLGAFSLGCEGELGLSTFWRSFFKGAGDIYGLLATPLLESLPESGELIAIGVASPILVPIKAAFFVTVCAMMPFILSEVWSFVTPGLYPWYDDEKKRLIYDEEGAEKGRDEKKLAFRLIATSAALFYVGMVVAYFVLFRVVFWVIAAVTPGTVNWTPDIDELFGAMLLLFFTFGLLFELPVATFILVRSGVVELEALRRARRWVVVGAFVVAAIVTPPDIWSQIIFAVLCCLLYESGLLFLNPKEWWNDLKNLLRGLARFALNLLKFLAYKLRSRIKKTAKREDGGKGK